MILHSNYYGYIYFYRDIELMTSWKKLQKFELRL